MVSVVVKILVAIAIILLAIKVANYLEGKFFKEFASHRIDIFVCSFLFIVGASAIFILFQCIELIKLMNIF